MGNVKEDIMQCPNCLGKGKRAVVVNGSVTGYHTCSRCNGTGNVSSLINHDTPFHYFGSSSSSSYSEEPRGVFLSIVFGLIGGIGLFMTFGWIYGMVTGWSKSISSLLFILILFAAGAVITFLSWRNRWKLFFPLIIAAVFGWLAMFNIIPNGKNKPATTQTQTATATVNANVNFRAEPSTGDNIIRQLQQGERVTLTGETSGGWTQVIHEGDKGWISTEYLNK
jgi:hypothetical protein